MRQPNVETSINWIKYVFGIHAKEQARVPLEAGWSLAGAGREGLLSSAVEDTKYPSSCPACPSPGPVPLGNSEHNTQLCYLSVMLERIGPQPGWRTVPSRAGTEGWRAGTAPGLLQA